MLQTIPHTPHEQLESTPQTTPLVRIFRRGQLTEIVPPVDGLDEAYCTVMHQARSSQANGFEILPMCDPLVWRQTEPAELRTAKEYMQTFAGLEEHVCEFVRQAGHKVELTGHRPGPLGEPRWSALGGKTGDRRLLRLVQRHERGLIRYRPDGVDLAWCIAQIALAWPKERIVVVATRQHDAEYVAKGIKRYTAEVSLATTKHHPTKAKRIAVVTKSHLGQLGVQAERRTILISVNPTELLNDTPTLHAKEWLPKMRCRLFGFLPETAAASPRTRDLLTALFGSRRLFVPRHGFHDLPVQVISLPFRAGQKPVQEPKAGDDVHTVKCRHVWHDGLRNRWIAGLARALGDEDAQALVKKYPAVAKTLLPRLGQRVGILVENVDHGTQLLKRLPRWPIVADPVVLQHSLAAEVRQAVEVGQDNSQRRTADVIVTTSAVRSAGVFDVLIRADAGTGLPPISDSFFVAGDGTGKQLVVVDVEDRHHPHLRRRARWRQAAYSDRGWSVDGERPWHPSEGDEPVAYDQGTVFRLGYISKRRKCVPAETRAYLKRRERRAAGNGERNNHVTLKQVARPESLYECLQHLRQHGGSGPGLDGITYADLSPSEWGAVVRRLSESLSRSRYRPQAVKKVPIPKPGTTEKRVLSIGSTCDRIVAHAFDVAVKPHLDQLFLPGSWGFRPGRGVWPMLAHLKRTVEATKRWVLAIDDVRKAFDNVPVDKLMEAMRTAQQDLRERDDGVTINDSVVKLLAVMAKGTTQTRTIGIDQGHNTSPLALNVLLHYAHDLPLTAVVGFPFWSRYADNLVYLCRSVSEGRKMLDEVGVFLRQSGLTLKGKDGVTDLRKNPAQLLGFQLREKDGSLRFLVGGDAWHGLDEHLRDAHEARDPLRVADEMITGWINAFGPAFENGKAVVSRVCALANQFGFREISRERIERLVTRAWERWRRMLEHESVNASSP